MLPEAQASSQGSLTVEIQQNISFWFQDFFVKSCKSPFPEKLINSAKKIYGQGLVQ